MTDVPVMPAPHHVAVFTSSTSLSYRLGFTMTGKMVDCHTELSIWRRGKSKSCKVVLIVYVLSFSLDDNLHVGVVVTEHWHACIR